MDVNPTLLGQSMVLHAVLAAVCTVWYARRRDVHGAGGAVLLVFAWLVPMVGVLCLAIFLVASSSNASTTRKPGAANT